MVKRRASPRHSPSKLPEAMGTAAASADAGPSRAASAKGAPSDKPVRVYADGIFDLFHFGHARALEQAKKLFHNTYLLVGVCSDAATHAYKGKTVMNEEERYESLRHCKWVDEVITDAPWVIDEAFLEKHNIDFVAHDDLPYADASGAADDVYGFVKAAGRFKATARTEGISTSDIILRILKDYNEFVMRNLARGYSRRQLGISALQEQRLRAQHHLEKMRQRMAGGIRKRTGAPLAAAPSGIVGRLYHNGEQLAENFEAVFNKVRGGAYVRGLQAALGSGVERTLGRFVRSFEATYSTIEQRIRDRLQHRR